MLGQVPGQRVSRTWDITPVSIALFQWGSIPVSVFMCCHYRPLGQIQRHFEIECLNMNVLKHARKGAFRLGKPGKPAQDHLRFDICWIKKTFVSNYYRVILADWLATFHFYVIFLKGKTDIIREERS